METDCRLCVLVVSRGERRQRREGLRGVVDPSVIYFSMSSEVDTLYHWGKVYVSTIIRAPCPVIVF